MRVSASFFIPLAIVAAGLVLRIADPAPLQALRGDTFDLYQRLLPRPYLPSPVRVIDIDDESLRRIGQWPWPRTVVAQMIEKLRNAGASAIALDIIFAEPDRTSPSRILPLWPRSEETDILRAAAAAGRLPDHDEVLAKTIAGGRVVTGFALKYEPGGAPVVKAGVATIGPDPLASVPRFGGALTSLDSIQEAAAGNAALTMIPDADGVLRRIQLLMGKDDTVYPTLGAEALRVAVGAETIVARADSPGRLAGLVIGEHSIPTNSEGQIRLYDTGPVPGRVWPAWKIFESGAEGKRGSTDSSLLQNFDKAIVFVGSSAIGIEDVQHSPLSTVTLGVAIHAQAVEQILSRSFIFRPDWTAALEVMFTVLIGIILTLLLPRLTALSGFALVMVLVLATLGTCWIAFVELGYLLAPGYSVATIAAVYLSCTLLGYLSSEKQRREVRAAFGQYLAPVMIDQLAANPNLLSLGGDMREVTVLFCDIRGFTAMSERLGAEDLTRLVNRFLTAMSGAILESGGTIDKYIGDCVMAFWNAPLDDPAHAQHACEAALLMRARLGELNKELRVEAQGKETSVGALEMGIGINTGPCCVGNMGSEQRFNYSVLGDSVNLAARFEEESKSFDVDIIVGESTRQWVPELNALALGQVTVRGRKQPVEVYTLPENRVPD
ncbi:MAG: CHASE2 domain-containing protein [Alphaproteobacteria bacterium]|nr:CHASE2 domain-containing protein [Alphaproteobacteria bacterium]